MEENHYLDESHEVCTGQIRVCELDVDLNKDEVECARLFEMMQAGQQVSMSFRELGELRFKNLEEVVLEVTGDVDFAAT